MQHDVCYYLSNSFIFSFFLGETGTAGLAIPLNTLSRSPGSSIRRTKTKCSMGYNSVRLVLVEDCRLYTSVSLWCHSGILHWYTHTRAKVAIQWVIWAWNHINHCGVCATGKRRGWDANLKQPRTNQGNGSSKTKRKSIDLLDLSYYSAIC